MKLDLTYPDKIHLDKWGIDVVPYISTEEMVRIVNLMIGEDNEMSRENVLIAGVLIACTNLCQDEEFSYTYDEVIYSGLWDDIINCSKYLYDSINLIRRTVNDRNSIETRVNRLIDTIIDKLDDIDFSKFDMEELNNLMFKFEGLYESGK